jgi:DNA-binding response OmpR family regulator
LDVGLPDGSGFNVAREVKTLGRTPVVFLTAMNSAEHRLEGFEIGCDDFIPKPFHLKEFLLRVKKVINASLQQSTRPINSAVDIKLNKDLCSVTLPDGKIAEFSQSDFELLSVLIAQSPKVVTRQEAFSSVFKGQGPATRTVDNSIVRIRTLLGEWAQGNLKTVRGVGYQWVAKK